VRSGAESDPRCPDRRRPTAADAAARRGPGLRLVIAAIAALALALRLLDLSAHSLWFDEALEYGRASGSLTLALLGRSIDQDPPLLALANHFWLQIGHTEWWLRAPSALVSAAGVFLAGCWISGAMGKRAGITMALLCALAPVQVHYGQEVNQYAAMIFLAVALLIAWESVVRRPRATNWARFALVGGAGLLTHYGMAFPLAVTGGHLAIRTAHSRDGRQLRYLFWTGLALLAVVAVLVWLGLADRISVWHLQRRFGGTYLGKEVAYLGDILWREVLVFFLFPFAGGPVLWAVRSLALLALGGAVAMWRQGGTARRIVGVAFLAALATVYPADGLGLYPIGHRYVLFAAPPFFAALAAGFDRLAERSRPAGFLALGATLALFAAFAPQQRLANRWLAVPREELGPVLAEVAPALGAGDRVYVYYGASPAYAYYGLPGSAAVIAGRQLGSELTAAAEAGRIDALAGRGQALWVVVAHERAHDRDDLLGALVSRGWRITASVAAENASATRLEPP
jgi:4-amino-4-deoxy-L-arabinose transferase-like glycosyltransferase